MRLIGNVKIHFAEETITEYVLHRDRQKWDGQALLPGIEHQNLEDSTLLHALLFELTPFEIVSVTHDSLVFDATLKRFPYTIDGKYGFASFGLRLVLKDGSVESINLDKQSRIAVNSLKMSSGNVFADLGNGSLHLEIICKPIEGKLGEISPPEGCKEEVNLHN